ncbi:hypothetical protein F4813DRAFT_355502 [Daldinia decipiens]|uniref:uncharacterized protein n=1 Tax=Daldinia decipiens TaxID=326647 RepID=UPI0020C4EFD0|nr:uncharacterized protein F4813DRAFT_355502 [Daldinia decipiens]KAI1659036.1 hypothetical protein F4813DRAFT_355502 [Daldinia decipiens]
MAKERAEKLHKKAEKPEKKVSKDKVKKQKKEKKSKRVETPEDSDNEPSKLQDTPAAAEESSAESAPEAKLKKEKKRPDKKAEKSKKKEKKSKKAALEEAVADGASNDTKLPVRPISKDSDSDSDSSDDDNGPALFTIDTKPTPIDPNTIPQKADAADEDDETYLSDGEPKGPSKIKPPTGLNRQARRRIRIIERQREKITKELGADAGADDVQARLDRWVEDYDSKAAARMDKKKRRKDKEAARIRNKKGKLLTGRRLKERKKVLDKMDRKASKRQGLSAQNAA